MSDVAADAAAVRLPSRYGFGPVATGRAGSALHSLHEPG